MPTTFHRHWRDVPAGAWRWPDFLPAEIACRGSGSLLIDETALDALQALRDRIGQPMIVRSGYRSPAHNRAVGGAPRSKHMKGQAFDIAMANHDPVAFEVLAETQTAILPLVPYLDALRWVFIAVALGGIAVTIYAGLDSRFGKVSRGAETMQSCSVGR